MVSEDKKIFFEIRELIKGKQNNPLSPPAQEGKGSPVLCGVPGKLKGVRGG
jgi:hypothetical protein